MNERALEDWLKYPDDCLVDDAIAHRRFVNHPTLRIVDDKLLIRAVPVSSARELITQTKDVVLQVPLICLNVRLTSLPAAELSPGGEEVLR